MVKIENLIKKYGNKIVLDGLSYEFLNSGITCILGPSGCGKSTLFNIIAGFDTEYDGTITVAHTVITSTNASQLCEYRAENIGFIFQDYHLLSGFSVLDNILMAGELNCKSKKENLEKATNLLQMLQIEHKANSLVEQLSGGQKQRVAIARALINDPKLILADEPTGALDSDTAEEIMALFKELSTKVPVLIITHDKNICSYADEVLELIDGKLYVDAPCAAIKREYTQKLSKKVNPISKPKLFIRSALNVKKFFGRYMAVALIIAMGTTAMLQSFSSQNIMNKKINDFTEKNTNFNSGYIALENEESPNSLLTMVRKISGVKNAYLQYEIPESSVLLGDYSFSVSSKNFSSRANENMVMGVMPKSDAREIAITPSAAKKLTDNIGALIGKTISYNCGGFKKELTISGIYNGQFDDYYVSSNVEQELYEKIRIEIPVSLSYEVYDFGSVLSVEQELKTRGISPQTASQQVEAFLETFRSLKLIFSILSIVVLSFSVFLSFILLSRFYSMRKQELGLMSALGYKKSQISKMLLSEAVIMCLESLLYCAVIGFLSMAIPNFDVLLSNSEILFTIALAVLVTVLLVTIAGGKVLKKEPALALKTE